jgi:hypothetical protein
MVLQMAAADCRRMITVASNDDAVVQFVDAGPGGRTLVRRHVHQ